MLWPSDPVRVGKCYGKCNFHCNLQAGIGPNKSDLHSIYQPVSGQWMLRYNLEHCWVDAPTVRTFGGVGGCLYEKHR